MINFELDDSGLTFLDSLDKYEPDKVKPRVLSDNNIEDPSYALSLRLLVRVLNVIVFLPIQILFHIEKYNLKSYISFSTMTSSPQPVRPLNDPRKAELPAPAAIIATHLNSTNPAAPSVHGHRSQRP